MKFEVTDGKHCDRQGRLFSKGDIVESRTDLSREFKNKFKRADPMAVPTRRPITVNSTLRSNETLPAVSPAKPLLSPLKSEEAIGDTDDGRPKGADVTAEFPKAAEEDYKIFKFAGRYHIYDAEDLDKALNGDGSKRAEVDKAIDALAAARDTRATINTN